MMEFDEIIVKESPGLCRCCLSEGCYKDLGTEYTWMNDTEVYADMLLECFDIGISQQNDGPNGPNRLICEVCITRLRDACNFKKQVLESEKRFIDMIGRGEFRTKVMIYPAMKPEAVTEEVLTEEGEIEYLEEDMEFEDEATLLEDPNPDTSDDVPIAMFKSKSKRGRPKKTSTVVKPEKKTKSVKSEEKPRTSKAVYKGVSLLIPKDENASNTDTEECEANVRGNTLAQMIAKLKVVRENVLQVLVNSSVMPFKWLRPTYRCFYCYEVFLDVSSLKAHTENHSQDYDDVYQAINIHCELTVLVDVSEIACKLCSNKIKDFGHLISHLTSAHHVQFDKIIRSCVYSYRLSSSTVDCVDCHATFTYFGHLLLHSNKDHGHGNVKALCDICGQYFKSTERFKYHITNTHERKQYKCSKCNMVLTNQNYLRTHMKNFHDKRYKCLSCEEVFESLYRRSQHMTTVHKIKDAITCPQCPLTFVFRSTMNKHIRETHLQEKNIACPMCEYKCFLPNRLRKHLIKHSDVRPFKCAVCDKAFKTRKTMKQHHNNLHKKILKTEDVDGYI